ncbi:MAG TPA: heterodisulfide reductase-related iron-sulfur binding cluster [Egibacteraceae bacterium]|nr:heterodisulfide reductase-related iron-sulfur binding cluster [Egibacteraceae bacterium]
MGDAGYASYFGRIRDLERLQTPADTVSWMERYAPADRAYEYVLYLGCNILRTPYIAHDIVSVFRALGLDFAAMGGVQFCCGIPWEQNGDTSQATKVGRRTVARITDYKPKVLVMWCPSCNVHFTDAVLQREGPLDCEIVHTPALLARLAAAGTVPWERPVHDRVVVHAHQGRDDHGTGRERAAADAEAVAALLGHVPGIEVARVVVSPPVFDYDCGPVSAWMPPDELRREQDRVREEAMASGATTLVTISHACHREWCGRSSADLSVRNYSSIVAEALGPEPMTDWLQRFRAEDDPERVVDMAGSPWRSHGLTRDEALAIARGYFGAQRRMSP